MQQSERDLVIESERTETNIENQQRRIRGNERERDFS